MTTHFTRPADALLAGVCAELSRRIGWNVWGIRCLFAFCLFIRPLETGIAYLVLAAIIGLVLAGTDSKSEPPGGLASENLSKRGRRIADLERKFNELDRNRR